MSNVDKKAYISGFDFVKLFGCCLVAFSHSFLNNFLSSNGIRAEMFFGEMVSVFFIIAGFLLASSMERRKNPTEYIRKYILKYFLLYYCVAFVQLLVHYVMIWYTNGVFMYKDFIYVMVTMPVLNLGPVQLWFIPPLLLGVGVSGIVLLRGSSEIYQKIMFTICIITILLGTFSGYINDWFPYMYDSLFKLRMIKFVSHYIRGLFFVWCGTKLYKQYHQFMGLKMKKVIVISILFSLMEAFIYYHNPGHTFLIGGINTFSLFIWSIILMRPILAIKIPELKKWHKEITVFSGLMYFLHIFEAMLLDLIIHNSVINFFIYTVINMILTFVICYNMGRKEKA